MPDAPPSIFVPPSAGSPPAAPGGVFEVPGGGSAPDAPGAVFTAPGGGGAPDAPGAVFVPPASAAGIPETLTITGITGPADSDPLEVTRVVDDLNDYPVWALNSDWEASWEAGSWRIFNEPGTYLATKVSSATTPVGLTDWTVTTGTGQPVIAAAGYQPAEAPAAIFSPPIDGGSPSSPPPIFGMPVSALYNSDYTPLLNTDDALLTTIDA